MSGTRAEIVIAEAAAAAAKERLRATTARLKSRLNPSVRARETWEDIRDKGETLGDDALELAYEKPRVAAGIASAAMLLLLRRPLARLARGTFRIVRRKPKFKPNPPTGAPIPLPDHSGERP